MFKPKVEKAVVLKYLKNLKAPFLVCKGKNNLASRIEEIAKENNVVIMENSDLADKLYLFEAGDFIPEELYAVTAEIFAFVYNIKK